MSDGDLERCRQLAGRSVALVAVRGFRVGDLGIVVGRRDRRLGIVDIGRDDDLLAGLQAVALGDAVGLHQHVGRHAEAARQIVDRLAFLGGDLRAAGARPADRIALRSRWSDFTVPVTVESRPPTWPAPAGVLDLDQRLGVRGSNRGSGDRGQRCVADGRWGQIDRLDRLAGNRARMRAIDRGGRNAVAGIGLVGSDDLALVAGGAGEHAVAAVGKPHRIGAAARGETTEDDDSSTLRQAALVGP